MNSLSKIKQSIKTIAETAGNPFFIGQVKEVSGSLCKVIADDEFVLSNVRLKSVINDEKQQIIITPKIGSHVLVADISGGNLRELVVLMFSEIEKIEIALNETTIQIDDIITINGGTNGGMVLGKELTNKLNDLVEWCRDHTHPNSTFMGTVTGTTVSGVVTVPSPLNPPMKFDRSHYSNDKIQQ